MIQATTSINCSPIKPSFKQRNNNTELMTDAAEIIKSTDLKNLDEDKLQDLKGIVEKIEVNPDSKIQGPLKTFALSLITLATGTLLSRGTASKGFYLVKDKAFTQKMFSKLGTKLAQSTKFIEGKAAAADTMGRFKKYSYKALNYLMEQTNKFSEKGVKAAKDSAEFLTQKAENLTKKTVQAVGSAVGLTTTGAALSVDKDENGKSDMLEFREKKKEQKAVIDLASAVLDVL